MMRTQVYLPKRLYQRIQLKAEQANKPAGQLVRELLEEGLRREQRETAGEALLRLVKIGGKGPADLSRRSDDYLYGDAE